MKKRSRFEAGGGSFGPGVSGGQPIWPGGNQPVSCERLSLGCFPFPVVQAEAAVVSSASVPVFTRCDG
jgi:hypothetical protein